jgi:PTH1 family peptidyl-tRNA hydrolase
MLLLVGLGNPGGPYAGHRHNIGFMAVDAVARAHGATPFRSRFQGLAAECTVDGEKVVLLKPATYMNDSGQSVGAAARFFKLGLADVAVVHDELDLAPAKLRTKAGGGNAGHNGLRSITAHLGNDYRRVRLGIGHPGDKDLVHGYVLSDFGRGERPWVAALCDAVADHVGLLAKRQDASFANKVHLRMEAAGFADAKPPGR